MIRDRLPVSLQVPVNGGTAESARAVSFGLIVTELVINALKHAFPKDRQDGQVAVSYQIDGPDWKLVVSDNGIGKPDVANTPAKGGLGTTLVKALALGPRYRGRSRQRPGRRERVAHARGLPLAATLTRTDASSTPRALLWVPAGGLGHPVKHLGLASRCAGLWVVRASIPAPRTNGAQTMSTLSMKIPEHEERRT